MVNHRVSDIITRIRNSISRSYHTVNIEYTLHSDRICQAMHKSGFLSYVSQKEIDGKKILELGIKYDPFRKGTAKIRTLKTISKPSQRIYMNWKEIVNNSRGSKVLFVSTSSGIKNSREIRTENLGGEVLFSIN